MKECNKKSPKASDPNYICNPETGLWVKKDGKIGKKILDNKKSPEKIYKQKSLKKYSGAKHKIHEDADENNLVYIPNGSSSVAMLAKNLSDFRTKIKGTWYMSEKFDGIRAIWTGEKIITRSNREFNYIPQKFMDKLPKGLPLDGEFFVPGKPFSYFSAMSVKKEYDPKWNEVVYMVFDIPTNGMLFKDRLNLLNKLDIYNNVVKKVEFIKVDDIDKSLNIVDEYFNILTENGGEGIMLINEENLYEQKRTKDLLKYKKENEAECIVVDYLEGTNKYKGILGAFLCKTPEGKEFHLGSGLLDSQRECYNFKDGKVILKKQKDVDTPEIGDLITYKYMELNIKSGIPRLPIFKSSRHDI